MVKEKRHLKILVIIIFILVVVVGFYLAFCNQYNNKAKIFLGAYKIESLISQNDTYSISGGRLDGPSAKELPPWKVTSIYRLAVFYKYTKEHPLLADSSLDVDDFTNSLDKFSKVQDDIRKFLGTTEDIVPVSMLLKFAEASKSARQFELNPSEDNAVKYLSTLDSLVAEYKKSLDQYNLAINKFGETSQQRNMISGGSYTNMSTISAVIGLIQGNAKQLEKELVLRRSVLKGAVVPENQYNTDKVGKVEVSGPISLLPLDELSISPTYIDDIRGVYGIKTACYDGIDSEKYFYVYNKLVDGKSVFTPKNATNNYYTKLSTTSVLDKPYLDRGMTWKSLREENSYNCLDNTYQAELLNLDKYMSKYPKSLLSSNNTISLEIDQEDSVKISQVMQTENTYYKNSIWKREDLELLSSNYLLTYNALLKSKNESYFTLASDALERHQFIANKTSGIESLFAGTFQLGRFDDLLPQNPSDKEVLKTFSYLIRPNYSISYFSFSGLFWKENIKPKYMISMDGKYNTIQNIYDYKSLLSENVPKSELLYISSYLE